MHRNTKPCCAERNKTPRREQQPSAASAHAPALHRRAVQQLLNAPRRARSIEWTSCAPSGHGSWWPACWQPCSSAGERVSRLPSAVPLAERRGWGPPGSAAARQSCSCAAGNLQGAAPCAPARCRRGRHRCTPHRGRLSSSGAGAIAVFSINRGAPHATSHSHSHPCWTGPDATAPTPQAPMTSQTPSARPWAPRP